LLLNLRRAETTILAVLFAFIHMRFAIVTTSISAVLIAIVIAVSIAALSWVYPSAPNHEQTPNHQPPSSELEAVKS
jgi:hypothetical protein